MKTSYKTALGVMAAFAFPVLVMAQNAPPASTAAASTDATSATRAPARNLDVEDTLAQDGDASVKSPIDYAAYNDLMTRYAAPQNGRPKIAYKLIREYGREDLQSYLDFLAVQDVSNLPELDQLAYWLNVQNALVVSAITLEGKKKKNLKRLRGTGEAPGRLWTTPRLTLNGQSMSIADVETYILSNFKTDNVLYGLYQGVRGGPCINEKAYTGATIEAILETNAKRYINSRGIVHVNNDVVELTPIFLWHKDEAFGTDDKVLIAHLQSYAEPNLKSALYRAARFEPVSLNYGIDFYDIDKIRKERSEALRPTSRPKRAPAPAPRPQQPTRGGGYGS